MALVMASFRDQGLGPNRVMKPLVSPAVTKLLLLGPAVVAVVALLWPLFTRAESGHLGGYSGESC